ncbi:MAG TPA: methyltransferase domain-containing protein [Pyrinomonadaceae bacterium]|nr:methyltransferase domain-containing protein [Pyrinomonadaceae bacterium]
MTTSDLEGEIKELIDGWNRSLLRKDLAAAAQFREDGYSAAMPDGAVLTREEELALIASPGHTVESVSARNVEVRGGGDEATAVFENLIEGEYMGESISGLYRYTISFRRTGGRWRAKSSRLLVEDAPGRQPAGRAPAGPPERGRETPAGGAGSTSRLRGLVPQAVKSWVKGKVRSLASGGPASFQETAYIPYKPGRDFQIPRRRAEDPGDGGGALPVPPRELWLGYNYPVHGKTHVSRMLEIVYASGFSFEAGDRVLDFGCGAGRMIRHLEDLSETCEIWGTDISAEHIYWCKQHLSPPFYFATTTKVPHLPFEDGSFRLIYCGSLFTHIDDLADAWLLELRRILAPDGRLYLTIHDNHTIELFESGRYDSTELIRLVRSAEIYRESKDSFGMFTIGRDNESQVFYDTDYFSKTVRPMFDIISVTPEAYFYQTAFLLKRRSK